MRVPSPTQSRLIVRAIKTFNGETLPFLTRLLLLRNFVASISASSSNPRSVSPNDDILIGTTYLSCLLQAVGETSLPPEPRRELATGALRLATSLESWRHRGLDGSGNGGVGLSQDERGWACISAMECYAALKSPQVLKFLRLSFISSKEVTITGNKSSSRMLRVSIGRKGNRDWNSYLVSMKKWILEVISAFESR